MPSSSPPESMSRRHLILRTLADLPKIFLTLIREVSEVGFWPAIQYAHDHVVRLMKGAPPERFSRITEHVHVGGQYTASGYERLKARGVTSVISLRDEFDNVAAGIAPERHLYLPTVDDTPPTIEDLCAGVRMIRDEAAHGGQVYVHCMLGVGRSATLVAAYLVAGGMSAEDAWRTIRRRRPFIRPTEGQVALIADFAGRSVPCGDLDIER